MRFCKFLIPLTITTLCSYISYGQFAVADTTLTFKGNTIKFLSKTVHNIYYKTDHRIPFDKELTRTIRTDAPMPVSLNGQKIYPDGNTDGLCGGSAFGYSLRSYLFEQLQDELAKLEDGDYELWLSNVVIDTTGKVAYYDTFSLQRGPIRSKKLIKWSIQTAVSTKIRHVLDNIELLPGQNENKTVPFVLHQPLITATVVVAGHKVSFL